MFSKLLSAAASKAIKKTATGIAKDAAKQVATNVVNSASTLAVDTMTRSVAPQAAPQQYAPQPMPQQYTPQPMPQQYTPQPQTTPQQYNSQQTAPTEHTGCTCTCSQVGGTEDISLMSVRELRIVAAGLGIRGRSKMNKAELIEAILEHE